MNKKVVIIGHCSSGLSGALAHKLLEMDVQVVNVAEFEHEINRTLNRPEPKTLKSTPIVTYPFVEPISRKQRRANQRKQK